MDAHVRRLVDRCLAAELHAGIGELRTPGVHLTATDDERELLVLELADAVWLRGPADVLAEANASHRAAALEPETWRALLGPRVQRVLGPSVHAYTTAEPDITADRIEPVAPEAVDVLRSSVSVREWQESGFGGQLGAAFLMADDTNVLAAANLSDWGGAPTDVGVLVHPAARGRGLAATVGAAATRYAVRVYGRARWRALETNKASRAVARRLGFEEYGRMLVVTLAG